MATAKRKVVGKDGYGRDVYEGQVAIKDAHGNVVYEDADARSGPAHLASKHQNRKGSFNTGRKDAHGNDIWENPADKELAAEESFA
jgi:hypothetical protein